MEINTRKVEEEGEGERDRMVFLLGGVRGIVSQGWERGHEERERGGTDKVIMVLGEGRNIKGGCGGLWIVIMIICWTFVLGMVLQC